MPHPPSRISGTGPGGVLRLSGVSRTALLAAVSVVTALLASACGSSPASSGARKLEKMNITVGVVPSAGDASLYIAQQEGLFAKQGLHVKIVSTTSAGTVIPQMLDGAVDVDVGQWTSVIAAQAAGVARFHALANGSALGPHAHEIIVLPHSGITSPAQLRGKTIAVNALNGLDTMMVSEILAGHGITSSQFHFVAIPFPAMAAALAGHRVDAVEPAEPFVTQIETRLGAVGVADVDQGSLQNLPISGYQVTAQWMAKYPKTAAAFQRAVGQGQQIAATNRAEVQHAVSQGANIAPKTAAVMALNTFPRTVDSAQLQRIADLMLKYGQLKRSFNVTSMTG